MRTIADHAQTTTVPAEALARVVGGVDGIELGLVGGTSALVGGLRYAGLAAKRRSPAVGLVATGGALKYGLVGTALDAWWQAVWEQ